MLRFITPIVLVAVAIFIFFGPTRPMLDKIDELKKHQDDLNQALNNAREITRVRDDLQDKYNSFPPSDLAKLDKLLPDNVDNVRLIIDINRIASKHAMILRDIKIKADDQTQGAATPQPAVSRQAANEYDSLTLSFSVVGTYEDLRGFLVDLERSLRLVDIADVSFQVDDRATPSYQISLKTYWLKVK